MLTNIIKLILRPFLGVPVPFFPRNKSLCSPVPPNQKSCSLCSPFPKIAFVPVPLIFIHLFPCPPEIHALVPLFPKTSGRAWIFNVTIYTTEPYSSNACEIWQLKSTQNARLSQCIHSQSCFKNAISRATSCCTCRFQSAKVLLYWTQKKKVTWLAAWGIKHVLSWHKCTIQHWTDTMTR